MLLIGNGAHLAPPILYLFAAPTPVCLLRVPCRWTLVCEWLACVASHFLCTCPGTETTLWHWTNSASRLRAPLECWPPSQWGPQDTPFQRGPQSARTFIFSTAVSCVPPTLGDGGVGPLEPPPPGVGCIMGQPCMPAFGVSKWWALPTGIDSK